MTYPTPADLKSLNPLLSRFSEEDLQSFMRYLESRGFVWLSEKNLFYHPELQFSIRTMGLDLFVKNPDQIGLRLDGLSQMRVNSPSQYDQSIRFHSLMASTAKLCFYTMIGNLIFGWFLWRNVINWIGFEAICFVGVAYFSRQAGRSLPDAREIEPPAGVRRKGSS